MDTLHDLAASLPGGQTPRFKRYTKRNGKKKRNISKPNDAMRKLHAQLMRRLAAVAHGKFLMSAYGSVKRFSPTLNALQHTQGRYFYQLDITNAFPSVSLEKLAAVLATLDPKLGSRTEVERFLLAYCAGKGGGLATGAPASPLLFNIYCAALIDPGIRELCPHRRNTYTRYLDDLTISSDRLIPRILRRKIREVVESAGFEVNHRKSSVTDLHKSSVVITGACITRDGTMRPTDEYMRRVAECLHVPLSAMTVADAYRFNGLVSYLSQFGRVSLTDSPIPWPNVSRDAGRLYARCIKRLERLVEMGLLNAPPRTLETTRIPEDFLQELRMLAPIEEVCGWYMRLKKRPHSPEYLGLSPFQTEKTPSFTVSPQKGFYHDFSTGRHGDIFDIVMAMEKVTFRQAVGIIAGQYGVGPPQAG